MSKVRIGIIGAGQRVSHHGGCVFGDCVDEVEIAAICDNRPERLAPALDSYGKHFGGSPEGFGDYREMLDKAKLDGVYVATPNDLHVEPTLLAFEKGMHVLSEKPMEVTLERCDQMIGAAEAANLTLGLAMQMHYRVRYHKIREIIESGRLGEPAMLWCTEYRGPFAEMKDWVWEQVRSGGAIVEKNCHHYDILDLWVASDPTTVYATGNILKHHHRSGRDSEIVDNAWIVNDYACGARAMVGICFLAEGGHYREFGVQGTEGKAFFSSLDGEIVHVDYNNGDHEDINAPRLLRGGLWKDFVDCIRTGRKPLVTGERGRKSLLVPLAAELSIREHRIVHVDELTGAAS